MLLVLILLILLISAFAFAAAVAIVVGVALALAVAASLLFGTSWLIHGRDKFFSPFAQATVMFCACFGFGVWYAATTPDEPASFVVFSLIGSIVAAEWWYRKATREGIGVVAPPAPAAPAASEPLPAPPEDALVGPARLPAAPGASRPRRARAVLLAPGARSRPQRPAASGETVHAATPARAARVPAEGHTRRQSRIFEPFPCHPHRRKRLNLPEHMEQVTCADCGTVWRVHVQPESGVAPGTASTPHRITWTRLREPTDA